MRVYVASKWENKASTRALMDRLEEMGHTITFDWTSYSDSKDDGQGEIAAKLCAKGVKRAQFIVCLMIDSFSYKGVWVEFGIAVGKGMPIYLIGHAGDSCLFTHLPQVKRFDNEDEFLQYIMG